MSKPIVTRFAPSPTGYLHIGGARTALFNWLYARGAKAQGQGKFLLRIEDTDRARHNEAAVQAILDGLSWLGLDWNGAPISQFSRVDRHREVAKAMLETGSAYRCWLEGDELNDAREAAQAAGERLKSPWRDADKSTWPDKPFAIRLKAPQTGESIIHDCVQGEVRFPAEALDDMVLLRSDGNPTYMHAVVVDDHDMGVTHVIRGDDHLVNAGRQKQLYEALGWDVPIFAHIPLIHGADGAKLSKRHGALGVEAYRDMGILPEALRNYLLRLGWSHGDAEIISREQAFEWFDIEAVNKAPSRLDIDKLTHINHQYIRQMSQADFIDAATTFAAKNNLNYGAEILARLQRGASFLQDRCATLADLPSAAGFLTLARPIHLEGKTAKPLQKEGALALLAEMTQMLENSPEWTALSLENALKSFVETRGIGFGQIGPAARVALTSGLPSPSLGEVLYALGRDESLLRLKDQLPQAN